MPLQSSGQISLNEIHVEAGGSSGTQAAINDADIRSLIGASSGQSNLSFSSFYGASSGPSTWTSTMTVGSTTIAKNSYFGYSTGQYGSMTDTTIDAYNNASIVYLYWISTGRVLLAVSGNQTGTSFTSLQVGSTTFTSATCTRNYTSGNNRTNHEWTTSVNPFGLSGTKVITWNP